MYRDKLVQPQYPDYDAAKREYDMWRWSQAMAPQEEEEDSAYERYQELYYQGLIDELENPVDVEDEYDPYEIGEMVEDYMADKFGGWASVQDELRTS